MTESTNFNFYQANNVYGELFFQFPKVLMYGEKYKGLSDTAKLAYMVLKDRLEYSLRNHWVDEDDHVYFIFTIQELKDLFSCSNTKVTKVKHELESANLLFQKQMGFNVKTGQNEPNRLYLATLETQATDVYLRPDQQKAAGTLGTSGIPKNSNPHDTVEDTTQTLGTSGIPKNGHDLYKDFKNIDTNRYNIDTQKLDFSTTNFSSSEIEQQNQDLVKHANEFLTDKDGGLPVFLEPKAVQLLSFWCRTPQQMRRFIGIILNAKYRVEKDHQDIGVLIPLDDPELQPLMTKTLRRYFNALRSNEKKIKDVENYLYGTMQNLFANYWNKKAARRYYDQHPEEEKPADDSWLYY